MDMLRIAVDAMGGDNAPHAPVAGAVSAVASNPRISVKLLGDEKKIQEELSRLSAPADRVEVIHCTEMIEMAESPVAAIQNKKDSSIVRGMKMVRTGEADAFVSAGSTGAILVGGQVLVGRLKGVERPPLAALVPTERGMALVIDCGASVDARPTWLLQFAQMGSIYMEHALKIRKPRVGLINIGAEEEKGNALVKETFPLLKECDSINFIGSVEARDVPSGAADVIVTDAWSGNLVLKTMEGTASMLLHVIKDTLKSSPRGMLGGAVIKKPLKAALSAYDSSKYGGAPLLGLKGLVVKAHGSSTEIEFANTVNQCVVFYEEDVNGKIKERMEADADKIRAIKKAARDS